MKPSLDLLLFTSQLSRSLGFRGTFLLFGNYYLTVKVGVRVCPCVQMLESWLDSPSGHARVWSACCDRGTLRGRVPCWRRTRGQRERRNRARIRLTLTRPLADNFMQILQWWSTRAGYSYTRVSAIDQTCQLDLQDPNCVRVDGGFCDQVFVECGRVWADRCATVDHA